MDKQFMRILMLSVLLPAGAALGEALQQEHLSFPPPDRAVLSRLEQAAPVLEKPVPPTVRTVAAHRDDGRHDPDQPRSERR